MESENPQVGVYGNQVGGSYLLLTEKGRATILKPLSKCESGFYDKINNSVLENERKLLPFLPIYGGTVELSHSLAVGKQSSDWLSHLPADKYEEKKLCNKIMDSHYVRLENLTYGMTMPCVLDVKIGIRKWKASHIKFQHSTTPTHGFRLNGCEVNSVIMKVYQHVTGYKLFRNKYFYHSIPYEQLPIHLAMFVYNGDAINRWVLQEVQLKLDVLISVFSKVRGIQFESLSLFICYEGSQESQRKVVLKLIDFGHVAYEGDEVDTNRLNGITQFRNALREVSLLSQGFQKQLRLLKQSSIDSSYQTS